MYSHILYLLISFSICINFTSSWQNGLARLPPMGWMSTMPPAHCNTDCKNDPNNCMSETFYKKIADILVTKGFRDVGYTYVYIDDCWMSKNRSVDGKLVANPELFPSGMNNLSQYMHDRGLKLGLYEDVGNITCKNYPGCWGHEDVDAQTFADWGIDYIKYDQCVPDINWLNIGYPRMAQALNKTGRPIVFGTEWAAKLAEAPWLINYTLLVNNCNVDRIFEDIRLHWYQIMLTIDWVILNQDQYIKVNGPGYWNDPDTFQAGFAEITLDQARAQMSIWSIWSAPLVMSADLRNLSAGSLEILTNKNVIAVDQDPLGIMARMIKEEDSILRFVKKMTPYNETTNQYSYAVALLNRSNDTKIHPFTLSEIGLNNTKGYSLLDLWTSESLGTYKPSDTYIAIVPGTGVNFFKATVLF